MMNWKLLCLLPLTFLRVNILVADISVPEAAVEIEIQVSKDKIYVGDSIDVYATITLLKGHPNYSEGNEYHVLQLTNYSKLPSGKRYKRKNPLWEVLYSDTTRIVDENPVVDFFYRIKLAKAPSHKQVDIKELSVVEYTEGNIGENIDYTLIKRIKSIKIGTLTIECLNKGLKERPENSNWYEADTSVTLSPPKFPPAGNPIDFKSVNTPIPVKVETLIRVINVDKHFLVDGEGYHVLANTTTAFKFRSPISDVSCDALIGSVCISNPNEITFKSANTVGARGYIYFQMDEKKWQMPIELTGNSDNEN